MRGGAFKTIGTRTLSWSLMPDPVSRCPESLLTGLEGQGPCTFAFPGEIAHHSQDWFQARDGQPGAVCAGHAAGLLCPVQEACSGRENSHCPWEVSIGPRAAAGPWEEELRLTPVQVRAAGSSHCQFCLPFSVDLLFFFLSFFLLHHP